MSASDELERRALRRDVAATLAVVPDSGDKASVRLRHATQRQRKAEASRDFVAKWKADVMPFFASGRDVDPARIEPEVRPVISELDAAVYRCAILNWSVPVTSGFGRRTRFLVLDRNNAKLIGVFCLSDPVYNLSVREKFIGWGEPQKRTGLYRVLDASVLGAMPPYNLLLGGKLVALCALSVETAKTIEVKYEGRKTIIANRVLNARPILITTTSALGRSSIYNRLRIPSRHFYEPIGWTKGFGTFQLPDDLFQRVSTFLQKREVAEVHRNRFGDGPNWKLRMLRVALEELELPASLLQHGIRREVFAAPLARNWRDALTGKAEADWYDDTTSSLASTYKLRWAVPRAARVDYRSWDASRDCNWLGS